MHSPPPQGLAAAVHSFGSDSALDHPNRVRSVNRDPLTQPGAFAAGAPRQQSAGNRIVTQGAANLGAWRHDDGPVRLLPFRQSHPCVGLWLGQVQIR